jgi:hypothetical protein
VYVGTKSFGLGVGVGAMYGYGGYQIRNGGQYGYEAALGKLLPTAEFIQNSSSCLSAASVLLFLSSVPRARKGPVPLTLAITGAAAAIYYGKVMYDFR